MQKVAKVAILLVVLPMVPLIRVMVDVEYMPPEGVVQEVLVL